MAKNNENSGRADDAFGNDAVNPEQLIDRETLGTVQIDGDGNPGFADENGSLGNEDGNGSGSGNPGFDPDRHETDERGTPVRNKDGSYRKKRGRKPGQGTGSGSGSGTKTTSGSSRQSGASKSKADLKASVDNLTLMLATAHVSLAAFTNTPELALEESEAENLAKAGVNLAEQFDYTPDPKVEAVLVMAATCASIYGPRFVAVKMRHAEERRQKKPRTEFEDEKPQPKKGGKNPQQNNGILSLADMERSYGGGNG